MAIVKFGIVVTGIRGSLGGTIFSANKAGPFCRQWSRPVNPRSLKQQTQRSRLSSHGPYWLALTQAQRDDWDTYAAAAPQEKTNSLGEAYHASGYNWFCQINTHLLLSDRARRSVFPSVAAPAAPTISEGYCTSPVDNNIDLSIWFPSLHFDGYDCIIFAAFAPRTTPIWITTGFRGCHFTVSTFNSWTYCGLVGRSYFGEQHENQKVFFKVYKQTTQGRRSAATTLSALVTT